MAAPRVSPWTPGAAKPPEDIAAIVLQVDKRDVKQVAFMADVLRPRLLSAGLSVSSRDGVAGAGGEHSVFLQVFASIPRLLAEAERQGFSFKLSSDALRRADVAMNLQLTASGVVFAPAGSPEADFAIPVKTPSRFSLQTLYDPYEFIYAQYKPSAARLYDVSPTTGSVLTETSGLKLLKLIVEKPVEEGGAGLKLAHLLHHRWVGCSQTFPPREAALPPTAGTSCPGFLATTRNCAKRSRPCGSNGSLRRGTFPSTSSKTTWAKKSPGEKEGRCWWARV